MMRFGSRHGREGTPHAMRQVISGTCLGVCLIAALAAVGYGQTFEVASLKVLPPAGSGERRGRPSIEPTTGNLAMRNVGMPELVMWAFKVGRAEVSNPEAIMSV